MTRVVITKISFAGGGKSETYGRIVDWVPTAQQYDVWSESEKTYMKTWLTVPGVLLELEANDEFRVIALQEEHCTIEVKKV